MSEEKREKIEFQFIMNYKAYRLKMVVTRLAMTLVAAGGLSAVGLKSFVLGIILPVMAVFIGVVAIIVSYGNEQTYTVYNTRIVIKKRGNDKRVSVPMDDIVSVRYSSAFYEKRFATGTLTISTENEKGKKKKYKLKHIFNARPAVEYLNAAVSERSECNAKDSR